MSTAIPILQDALEKLRTEMATMRDLLSRKQDEIARLRAQAHRDATAIRENQAELSRLYAQRDEAWAQGTPAPIAYACDHENQRTRRHQALLEAVERLYYAARWTADRPVDEANLWTDVRDAAGFEPGNSPEPYDPAAKLIHEAVVRAENLPEWRRRLFDRNFNLLAEPIPVSPDLPHGFVGPAPSGRCSFCEKALEHPIHESRAPECR